MAYIDNDSAMTFGTRTCPICKRRFIATAEWVYKRGHYHNRKIFCSWSCTRKFDKEHMSRTEKINEAISKGMTDQEIRDELGVTQRQIDFRRIDRE